MRPSLPSGRICGAVVLNLVIATRLVAQSNTGNVYGTVIDQLGSPISGCTATLSGTATPRTATADAGGFFRFLRVAPARYTITVTKPGFTTVAREGILVSFGQNVQVDFPMRLSGVQENVTVTDATPLIQTRQVETGRAFAVDQLTEIPTARDVWSLVQQVPGVQLDTVNVAGNTSGVIGGPGMTSKGSGNVAYEIDGATITGGGTYGNPFARQNGGTGMYFDFSTLDNVEVATGGSLLEQQNSGVTINVVTKRGTNQLKGSARYLYASANWQSDNTPQEAPTQNLQTNSTRYIREYGGEFGGPILKDRLWLWAAGSRQDISLNPGTYIPDDIAFPQTTILQPWSAKLNAQISNANSAALYYQRATASSTASVVTTPLALRRPERTTSSRRASTRWRIPTFFPLTFSGRSSRAIRMPIRRARRSAALTRTCSSTTPASQLLGYQIVKGAAEAGEPSGLEVLQHRQVQPRAEVQLQLPPADHRLDVGFSGHQNAGGDDDFQSAPGSRVHEALARRASSLREAVLERDARRHPHRRQSHGRRRSPLRPPAGQEPSRRGVRGLDVRGSLHQLRGRRRILPRPAAVQGQGAKDWQIQYTNWQPRISVTYALGQTKSTLLRASYAQFADQIGYLGYWASTTPTSPATTTTGPT